MAAKDETCLMCKLPAYVRARVTWAEPARMPPVATLCEVCATALDAEGKLASAVRL